MIPSSLTMTLAASREVVPFPALMESLMMEVTFEALREGGVRLPRPVGQTIQHRRRAGYRTSGRSGRHYIGAPRYCGVVDGDRLVSDSQSEFEPGGQPFALSAADLRRDIRALRIRGRFDRHSDSLNQSAVLRRPLPVTCSSVSFGRVTRRFL